MSLTALHESLIFTESTVTVFGQDLDPRYNSFLLFDVSKKLQLRINGWFWGPGGLDSCFFVVVKVDSCLSVDSADVLGARQIGGTNCDFCFSFFFWGAFLQELGGLLGNKIM